MARWRDRKNSIFFERGILEIYTKAWPGGQEFWKLCFAHPICAKLGQTRFFNTQSREYGRPVAWRSRKIFESEKIEEFGFSTFSILYRALTPIPAQGGLLYGISEICNLAKRATLDGFIADKCDLIVTGLSRCFSWWPCPASWFPALVE